MPINPAIAMGYQAPKFDDPMNRLVQMEQLKAYQQNALAKQLEMQVAQESLGQQRGLKNYLAGMQPGQEVNPLELAQFGKTGLDYAKSLSGFQKEQRLAEQAQTQNAINLYKEYYLPSVASINTVEDAQAWGQALHADPRMKPLASPEGLAKIPKDPAGLDQWKRDLLVPFQEQVKSARTEKEKLFTELNTLIPKMTTVTDEGVTITKPEVVNRVNEIKGLLAKMEGGANAPMAPAGAGGVMPSDLAEPIEGAMPPPPPPMVAPKGEGIPTRKPVVAQEPITTQEQIAQAKAEIAGSKKTAELKAAKEADRPSAIATATHSLSALDEMENNINSLLGAKTGKDEFSVQSYAGHPGLEFVTGKLAGTPTGREIGRKLTNEAADAAAIQDALTAEKFTSAISELKSLSSSGATGLGSLAVAEGEKLQNAFADLNAARGTEDYKRKLIEFKQKLNGMRQRIRSKIESTYGKDAFGKTESAPSAAIAGPKVGAIEDGHRFKGGDPSKPENWEEVR